MVLSWLVALRPVRGSARLLALRWSLPIVATLPGLLVARQGIGKAIANRPYFTEAGDRLPIVEFVRLLREIPGNVWGVLAAGVLLAWAGHLLLTAGAAEVLDPKREGPVAVGRTVLEAGTRSFLPFVRVALVALLAGAIGSQLLADIFARIGEHGEMAGWSGKTLLLGLGLGRGFLVATWLSIVGVFVLWSRVIVVADGRRYVRRLLPLVLRLWWRHPLGTLLMHVLLASLSLLAGTAVITGWRQSESGSTAWIVLWLAVILLQAFIWHWRIRASRLIWSAAGIADLRSTPDAPWGLLRRTGNRFRRSHHAARPERESGGMGNPEAPDPPER